jgi:type IV pilus assembly protein PilV
MTANPLPRYRVPQAGFSLMEVMVALLVLSIGLLGLAALQTSAIKMNHQSYQRTQATTLIYEIIDRMRANVTAASAGRYVIASGAADPTPAKYCHAAACTADELAVYDLWQWRNAVKGANNTTLAESDSFIQVNGTQHVITVTWKENGISFSQAVTVQLL